jgi:hypothetical protein
MYVPVIKFIIIAINRLNELLKRYDEIPNLATRNLK